MPKPGYTRIIVRSEVRDMLQKLAETQGYRSINMLLEVWLRVHPTSINGAHGPQETSLKTSLFSKKQFKTMVRPPGFEPGSPAWQADVLARLDYGR